MSLSRLEGWKRVDRVISIIEKIIQNHPELKDKMICLIIGEGSEAQKLKNIVKIKELDSQISELKNKLTEEMDTTNLTEEQVAEFNEQVQQIYNKGF